MLAVQATVQYEVPVISVGTEVIYQDTYTSSGEKFIEVGRVTGYVWDEDGKITEYIFAPLCFNSLSYPWQPVRVDSVITV